MFTRKSNSREISRNRRRASALSNACTFETMESRRMLSSTLGGDGTLTYSFSGTNTLPAGFSIDPTSTATSLKIAQAGVGIVMTIDLNLSTGLYTITHNQPIDHPTSSINEEDVTSASACG